MTNDIWQKHDKHFAQVKACAILDSEGKHILNVSWKYPNDGAGRLYCYVHIIGLAPSQGMAGGYGYDKTSAALQSAFEKYKPYEPFYNGEPESDIVRKNETIAHFKAMFKNIGGQDWHNVFRDNGYQVLNVL